MKGVKSYQMDMCSGPVLGKMLIFAVPLIASSVLQVLFNAVDVVVVGRFVGDTALAAVGCTSSLTNLIVNLFIGLSVGANVVVARYFGAKEKDGVQDSVHTSISLGFVSGIILTGIGTVGAPWFLKWMGTPSEVLPQATTYLRVYFFGITSTMVYNFGSAVLRAVGDTRRPLYFLLFSGLLNVGLNIAFVTVVKLGVAGVALATIIAQTVAAALVLWCLVRDTSLIHLSFKKLRIASRQFREILKVGLPAGFQGIVFALSNTVIQSTVNSFGAVVVAGNAAGANVEGFAYFSMNAFYQATISFASQNYGAGNYKRINRIVITAQCCAIVAGLSTGFAMLYFGRPLMGIYSSSAQVIEAGYKRLEVIMSSYFLCGMMDVMVGGLRGIGYSVVPMIVSLVGACGTRLLWIATLFRLPALHSPTGLYLSYPISWAITFSVHTICFVVLKRRLDRSVQNQSCSDCPRN